MSYLVLRLIKMNIKKEKFYFRTCFFKFIIFITSQKIFKIKLLLKKLNKVYSSKGSLIIIKQGKDIKNNHMVIHVKKQTY